MSEKSFTFGLIGYPVTHSLSPCIHTSALNALGLDGQYSIYEVPALPEGGERLEALLAKVQSGEIDGLNVTIPHKQSVLPYMDFLTDTARDSGAVNTIMRREGAMVGDNTDADAFLSDLMRNLPQSLDTYWAIVLGAGGAARAVVYALLRQDWRIKVVARSLDQAVQLAEHFQDARLSDVRVVETLRLSDLRSGNVKRWMALHENDFILVVNTTPVGMVPLVESSPWPDGAPWPEHGLAYDLVYNPLETVFMRQARVAGLKAVGGLGMLVEQAALAFERWTGFHAPRKVMLQAAVREGIHHDSQIGTG